MRRRPRFALTAAASAVLLALANAGCGSSHPPNRPAPSPAAGGAALPGPVALPGHSLLARRGFSIIALPRHGRVALYRGAGARRPLRIQRSPDRRFPLVLLVKQARAGWLQVYLPVRPNQSTAWIRPAGVVTRYVSYQVEVILHRHRLRLWRTGRLLDDQPIAVGRAVTPTPPGLYYIIQQFRLSDPGGPFGPYALGLSAYSTVLQSFGSGPGQIALHGTNDPGGIGANVSHGCIHLANREIARLAHLLPLGTPVRIRA